LCCVDTGRYVCCVLLIQGGMFIVLCWYKEVCLLCSVDAGRYVYCVWLIQGGMFIVVSNLGRYSLGLCRYRSSATTSVARMEVWVLSNLLLIRECR
jgi:hypothetical protein